MYENKKKNLINKITNDRENKISNLNEVNNLKSEEKQELNSSQLYEKEILNTQIENSNKFANEKSFVKTNTFNESESQIENKTINNNENYENNLTLNDDKLNYELEPENEEFDEIDLVFNENIDVKYEIWGQVLLKIKENNDNLLYAMCDSVTETKIVDDKFILKVKDYQNYLTLKENENQLKLQNYVSLFVNKKIEIEYNNNQINNDEDIKYLKSKFGDKLKVL